MSLMMRVSQRTREGHQGQVAGRAPATLAVNSGIFLGALRPVEGHRRHWTSWPSIISYPAYLYQKIYIKIAFTLFIFSNMNNFNIYSASQLLLMD